MAVTTTNRIAGPFIGNNVTTDFPFVFTAFADTDLFILRQDQNGIISVLVLGNEYVVTLNEDQDGNPGGTITLSEALPAGFLLLATTAIPELQSIVISNLSAFRPDVLTKGMDQLTILIQQLQGEVDRCIKVSPLDDNSSTQLPPAQLREGTYLTFGSDGGVSLVAGAPGGGGGGGGGGASVLLGPLTTQVVSQPIGTRLVVSRLDANGVLSTSAHGVYGDGVSDDTDAIRATIAAAGPGAIIFFPPGNFKVSSTLLITGDHRFITLRGSGKGVTNLKFYGSGPLLLFASAGATPQFAYCTVEDMTLDGSNSQPTSTGIYINNTANIDFKSVQVLFFTGDGLLHNSSQYCSFFNCEFNSNGGWGQNSIAQRNGIQVNSHTYINCYFNSNGAGGARDQAVRETSYYSCTFQNNTTYGHVLTGDISDAIGGAPSGTLTGQVSDNVREFASHYEFNTYQHYRGQYFQNSILESPVFASINATGGDVVVDNHILNLGLKVRTPFFTSVGPHFVIGGGVHHEIDLGNLTYGASGVLTDSSIDTVVYQGGQQFTQIVLAANQTLLARNGQLNLVSDGNVEMKSTNGSGTVAVRPQNSTGALRFTGGLSADVFVSPPQANGTMMVATETDVKAGGTYTGGKFIYVNLGPVTVKLAVCD